MAPTGLSRQEQYHHQGRLMAAGSSAQGSRVPVKATREPGTTRALGR